MAQRLKAVPDASRDLISELPLEVKDRILGCLRTPEAARIAVLSKHWNDVWLQHGQLAFDSDFLESVEQCYDDEGRTLVNIINNILFFRDGPVKKFTLQISYDDPTPQQSDFDRWCLFLSRNGVEELKICLHDDAEEYKLPFCLLSCRTIKQLIVRGPFIDLPINACGIHKFEICSPKLEMLSVIDCMCDVAESRWLAPHLKAIKTLWLCGSSLMRMDVSVFPTAINLQVMKLYYLNFGYQKQLSVAMQLLKKCPNLCELRIIADEFHGKDDQEAASRLLEDPDSGFVIQELKMLNTIKIESFSEFALEMLFMKMLLAKSPVLKRVVIVKDWHMNASEERKVQRKLECFPRASPNAQIIFTGNCYSSMSDDWLDTHGFTLSEI